MRTDSVDQMIEAWAMSEPELDVTALHVVGRILRTARYMEAALVEALRPHGLSFGDFDVLNTLRRRADPRGSHPSDLAESALITTGAMTARLNRLEQAGLIRRIADSDDGRAIRIRLTARGGRLARQALAAVMATDEGFLAPLTVPQRRQVGDHLRKILLGVENADRS